MAQKKYTQLTLSERIIIETLLGENRAKSYIAEHIGQARPTISNELKIWKDSSYYYTAIIAHEHAKLLNNSKRNKDKISTNKHLRMRIYRGLLNRLSPELIARRLKLMFPKDTSMKLPLTRRTS